MKVMTSRGELEETLLTPYTETEETEDYKKTITGYKLDGEIVQQSANIHLKKGLSLDAIMGKVG